MRIAKLLLVAIASICVGTLCVFWLALPKANPQDSNDPRDFDANQATLVGDMNENSSTEEIEAMKQGASRGDIRAANGLGNYYSNLGNVDQERRWRTVAANRGDCASMALLEDLEIHAGRRTEAAHWNSELRRNQCTWEKAYGRSSTPGLNDTPLWNSQEFGDVP
jgi:hypothetical protein